jgi:hypothetical protein
MNILQFTTLFEQLFHYIFGDLNFVLSLTPSARWKNNEDEINSCKKLNYLNYGLNQVMNYFYD